MNYGNLHSFFNILESHRVSPDSKIFNMTSMIGGKFYISPKQMKFFYTSYEKFILSKSSATQHVYLQEVLPRGLTKFFIDIDCTTSEASDALIEKCKSILLDLLNIEQTDLELLELSNTIFPTKKHVFALYRGSSILMDGSGVLNYLTYLIGSDKPRGLRLPGSIKKEGIEKGKYMFDATSAYNKIFYYSLLYHDENRIYKPTYKLKLYTGWTEYYNTIVNKPVQKTEKKYQTIFEKGEDMDEKIEWILERILQNNYSALEEYGSWWNIVQACKNLNFDVDKLDQLCKRVEKYEDETGVYKEYESKYQTKKTMGTLIFYLGDLDKKEFFKKFVPIHKGGNMITSEMRKCIEDFNDDSFGYLFYLIKKEDIKIIDPNNKIKTAVIWNKKALLWEYASISCIATRIKDTCKKVIEKYLQAIEDDIKKLEEGTLEHAKLRKYIFKIECSLAKCKTWSNCSNAARFLINMEKLRDNTFLNKLDTDIYSLPISRGRILNLTNGDVRKRTREDLFPEELDIYVGDSENENVVKFFMGLSNENKEVYNYIQEICGYALSGSIEDKSIFLIHGHAHTGKSEIVRLLSKILGRYYYASNNLLHNKKKLSGIEADPELASLIKKRVAVKLETSQFQKLDSALLKKLSGGDHLTARMLHSNPITFSPTAKIFIVTNHIPEFDLSDPALVDRLRYIEFQNVFEKSRENVQFVENIYKNHLHDVFGWMVKGAIRYFKNGRFTIPILCIEKQKKEIYERDDFGLWIDRTVEFDENAEPIFAMELYEKYKKDAELTDMKLLGRYKFNAKMETYPCQIKSPGGIKTFYGIRLKPQKPTSKKI
jgi:P4 family phage/plasmid primase-like protien